jgi:hypothetical protein
VQLVNPVVVLLVLGAIALAVYSRRFLRENFIWISWFLFAYITFSYYDNRQARFATFWWPSWVVLAAAVLGELMKLMPRKWAWTLPLFLLLPVPWQIRNVWRSDFTDFRQVQTPIASLFEKGNPGNILVFGRDKQIFVALIREHDLSRTVHVIRGERLTENGHALAEVCRRYRIGTVLVELSENDTMEQLKDLSNLTVFKRNADSITCISL